MSSGQIFTILSGLIGGLGLFLYGMTMMSEGLQKSSGDSLKKILEKLTSNRIVGTIVGTLVTAVIQSSSATTVMVVGFVNAGLMNLTQALAVILGANIGTTITAQIIAFKITAISLPCIGVGVILILFIKKPTVHYIGEIILGFGLLFFGMDIMTTAFVPLAKSEFFKSLFLILAHNPILAVLTGAVTTFLVQSSSATIGITIALATTGALDFQAAAALVLGENIGTTVTANIAALNANRAAKEAAFGHFLFNTIGVTYMVIFLTPFTHFINMITSGDVSYMAPDGTYPYAARHIANIHTMFNIINTIIFLPFIPLLAKLCKIIIKPDKAVESAPKLVQLSDAMLSTPEIAVGYVQKEVNKMFKLSLDALTYARGAVIRRDKESQKFGLGLVPQLNQYYKEIYLFLDKLSAKSLSERSEQTVRNIYHAIEEVRQIGERTEKLIKQSQKTEDKKIDFSKSATKELETLFDRVLGFTTTVCNAFSNNYKPSGDVGLEEDIIDKLRKEYKKNHIKRLNNGECTLEAGLIFVDMLASLEKIGDNVYAIVELLVRK